MMDSSKLLSARKRSVEVSLQGLSRGIAKRIQGLLTRLNVSFVFDRSKNVLRCSTNSAYTTLDALKEKLEEKLRNIEAIHYRQAAPES